MGKTLSVPDDLEQAVEALSTISDDIMQREDGPLCAAEIGSELQKQFAILPGGRGMNGNPIIVFPEFPDFSELEEEEIQNVLGYLSSIPSSLHPAANRAHSWLRLAVGEQQDAGLGFNWLLAAGRWWRSGGRRERRREMLCKDVSGHLFPSAGCKQMIVDAGVEQ